MYPYQRTPMGNPYISPIYPYILGVYGLLSPRIPREHNKYHGYTVRGTPNCPLIVSKYKDILKVGKSSYPIVVAFQIINPLIRAEQVKHMI